MSQRRASVAAFLGLAGALAVGVYSPLVLPELGDVGELALYLAGSLGVVALALVVTHRMPVHAVPAELGMDRGVLQGLAWALVLTVPMLLGFLVLRRGVFFEPGGMDDLTERPWAVLQSWAGAGLVEETLFRGYFFRQLVRRGGWPAGRAMLLCGLVFGLLHVPGAWGEPAGEIVGAVAVTAIGGAAFCWMLLRWDWNLWFVIGWHAFVNLWWTLGQGGDTAAGDGLSNALRLGVVALTVVATIRHGRLSKHSMGSTPEHQAQTQRPGDT